MKIFAPIVVVVTCAFVAAGAACGVDAKLEFFETKIRPVLVEHCYECHSQQSKKVRGRLLLDSQPGVAQGGESGLAVVPGKPEESLLLSALRHETYEMPPDRKLPDGVIANFEKWIRDGAVDPRTGGKTLQRESIDLQTGRQFWCFQPVRRPAVPESDDVWARTPIDRLIAAKHREAGVSPVADATPEQIARRLYFGLIGLPPSVDQIADFVQLWNDSPDTAIAETADELLASPRFGERWGRHWLDVTRFAESSGGGRSLMFADAWRFRDYVIRSFNSDKPFDRLIREHIAGDLLPYESDDQHDDQVTGVGYLTLGPTNYEQQDKELLRMEVVDEQVDTIGRTFLGLTLGCARCHDHKFDPVPTADYYALAGIFRSTETLTPGNVSGYVTTNLKTGIDTGRFTAWEAAEKNLQTEIKALRAHVKRPNPNAEKHIDINTLPGIVVDNSQAVFEGEWVQSVVLAPFVGDGYFHDDFKKTGRRVHFETALPKSGRYRVRLSHNYQTSRCSRLPVVIHHAEGTATVNVDQRETPPDGVFAELGTFSFAAGSKAVITIDAEQSGPGVVIIDAVQFLPVDGDSAESTVEQPDEAQQRMLAEQLSKLEAELKKHQKKKPTTPKAMGVRDQAEPADWHIHVRGGIRNLGKIVPRGFVSVARPVNAAGELLPAEIAPGQSGRRELADWVASPTNPLTSRVFVNRVWLHLIGEGLVRTPDNFGKTGRLPGQPELLDYLAATFVSEDQWSVKKLIHRIVTSRTYRLSSSASEELKNSDPDNKLLTRGFRRRLEAEALRDSMLQISGQLDLQTTGGLTIKAITQYDNGYDHDVHGSHSRSVYLPFFRNSMPEIFLVFDVANPNLVTGKRTASTLPAQALFLLNSPFVLEQSRLAAEHFLTTQSADPAAVDMMLGDACWQCVGRSVTETEREALSGFLKRQGSDSVDAWTSVFQALFSSMDFRYLD